ncbi:MAG: DUF3422 domain-containing protein [Pseudomonadota bacterium]
MAKNTSPKTDWKFLEERDSLIAEAHARPSQNIEPPAEVLHLAFRAEEAIQRQFFDAINADSEDTKLRHAISKVKHASIKLERHTEFMSCTLFRDKSAQSDQQDLKQILNDNFPMQEIEILVLLRLDIMKTATEMLKSLPANQRVYGGSIRGDIDARSTFIPDDEGFIHLAVHAKNITGHELGRRLQRLIEMETYRTMTLLGLPLARQVGSKLSAHERELEVLTVQLRGNGEASQGDDEKLFEQLSSLSEKTNILSAETRYRFAASRAYFDLFQQRLDSLEEEKIGDVQTMSGFLKARIDPAMATIESIAKRQRTLNDDLSRALLLLRTRIELNLNKGNQELLKSMDKRHDQQLKISRTVEGLSVIAITYYAVGLVSHLLKVLSQQPWMPLSVTSLTAISVPFILAVVWWTLHRIRLAWAEKRSTSD